MPCDYKKYPKDWKKIRQRIMERAGNRCEWCGVPHLGVGVRMPDGSFTLQPNAKYVPRGAPNMFVKYGICERAEKSPYIRIILAIAHIHDKNPMNCADDNLAALCQRCHSRHDKNWITRKPKAKK